MNAARLREVSEALFPGVNCCRAISDYLSLDYTTVFRWLKQDRVPAVAEIALELSLRHGVLEPEPEAVA